MASPREMKSCLKSVNEKVIKMDRLAVFMDIRTGDQSIIRPPFHLQILGRISFPLEKP